MAHGCRSTARTCSISTRAADTSSRSCWSTTRTPCEASSRTSTHKGTGSHEPCGAGSRYVTLTGTRSRAHFRAALTPSRGLQRFSPWHPALHGADMKYLAKLATLAVVTMSGDAWAVGRMANVTLVDRDSGSVL